MSRRLTWTGLAVGLFLLVRLAPALVMRLTPLSDILVNDFVFVARVQKIDLDKQAVYLEVTEDLKGKLPFRRLPLVLKGDRYAREHNHVSQMLKRLAPEVPVLLFANEPRGKNFTVFGYTNGTWIRVSGHKTETGAVLSFDHCEPYLRKTFKGTTEELRQILRDALAGKRTLPPPNPREPPGLGPEVQKAKSARAPAARGGRELFAVIPTFGLAGPLALLALLFPSLFGGVLVLFRRWTAFFTVVSLVSTLYLLHRWFAPQLHEAGWGSPTLLWLGLTLLTLLGVLWAWRRHLTYLDQAQAAGLERTERVVLAILSVVCGLMLLLYALLTGPSGPTWQLVLALAAAIWTGSAYRFYRLLARRSGTALPTEGVMLWASLCLLIPFTAMQAGPQGVTTEVPPGGEERPAVRFVGVWKKVLGTSGAIYSRPEVVGDRIFFSVAHKKGLETFGAVYCVDRAADRIAWTFDDDGGMKQSFSSPRVAAGKLYVGEGFHFDPDCNVYCVDARTGTRLWAFPTHSQTEATPCLADGKVFAGAGNDGLYALDTAGKKLWQYPPQPSQGRLLRIGAGPTWSAGRLFGGSGVERPPNDPGETAVFCLDAAVGKLLWKVPVNLPCWASPTVAGDRVYFALGNGDVVEAAANPAGAVLCLDAATGRQLWRTDLPDAVLDRAVVDRDSVYVGCRDGHCWCLSRATGKERWKKALGSPVLAAPVLDHDDPDGHTHSLFVAAVRGRISCLEARTGRAHWTYHDLEHPTTFVSSRPALVVRQEPEGERRQIYFGVGLQEGSVAALVGLEDFVPRERLSP